MRSTISKFTQISICSVILAFVLISNVLADSKKLDGGKATWTGGEDTGTNKIYSQLRDNKKDSIRYKVRALKNSHFFKVGVLLLYFFCNF